MYFTLSPKLAGLKNLDCLLEAPLRFGLPAGSNGRNVLVGWGRKPLHTLALRYANSRALPFLTIEDGFLRSVGLGKQEPPLSIVVDDIGIYYDANGPSRLELQISSKHSVDQLARARDIIKRWREGRLSKYNHCRESAENFNATQPYVLVVDQTRNDASIIHGSSDSSRFRQMLEAALDENPEHLVLLKAHPETLTGHKRGHFDSRILRKSSRIRVVDQAFHPVSLIEHADKLYTMTSQMGFEGLVWGKRVRTFGMPFYAGWGLTVDEIHAPPRRKPVALEDLVYAALVEYPRYMDPETRQRCEVERLMQWMTLQRKMRERFPHRVYAKGFSIWKKPIVRKYFQGSEVRFLPGNKSIPPGASLAVWGSRVRQLHGFDPESSGKPPEREHTIQLEDGFLRSVGLGKDLALPLSWVMDRQGIYYDPARPSDLEHILQNVSFEAAVLERASALRRRIVSVGITKYNINRERIWQRPTGTMRVILVPGQVETDASIACGAPLVKRNIELLQSVRKANPQAYVVYKPHPDVVAGMRKRGLGEENAELYCNEVVADCSMSDLLQKVDEVHVMTSLAGFEALLREKRVVVYGQPFYSGWGLTEDMIPLSRRSRKLTLDELTAGVLIEYPTYVSRATGKFTTPERIIDELIEWQEFCSKTPAYWLKLIRFYQKRVSN
ncbi:MAG: capsular polysaccharide biosynthesis protein [Hydrogenophilaceae bacterium]|nr:capsular polysaccharide biosynthesis protein [Hydrogenophilaceae bacterium]